MGGDGGEGGRVFDWEQWGNSDLLSQSQIWIRHSPKGPPRRCHGTVTDRRVTLYSLSDAFFVFCFSSRQRCQKSFQELLYPHLKTVRSNQLMRKIRLFPDPCSLQLNPPLHQLRTSVYTVRITRFSSDASVDDTKRKKKTASAESTSYALRPLPTSRAHCKLVRLRSS